MKSKTCSISIQIDSGEEHDKIWITVPRAFPQGLEKSSEVILKAGSLQLSAACSRNETEHVLVLSPSLASKLPVYDGMKTHALLKENKIQLGPLVGSFTDEVSVRLAKENRPGKKIGYLNEANAEAGTILYFFTVEDVDLDEKLILGTYYNRAQERWEQKEFPFPDVLYDRGGSPRFDRAGENERIRQAILENGVKRFNPVHIFDKWDIYKRLKENHEFKRYLPHTMRYDEEHDLARMLGKYTAIYIKERKGNRGMRISKVTRQKDGTYLLSYMDKELYQENIENMERLCERVNSLYEGKKCILQDAIDVLQIGDRSVDMRATVQRDMKGSLQITAISVRVGREGYPITTTRSGSEVLSFEDFFLKYTGDSKEEIRHLKTRVETFLRFCYRRIESDFGRFGEMGIDFALDRKKRLRFIECNAKPGKDTVYLTSDEAAIHQAFLNPLQYSLNLCGF